MTKENDGGIIKTGEVEYGVPYGEYSLNAKMEDINSDEYALKYNITDNPTVNESLLKCARKSISHRNGTKYEDMYIINAETGDIMGSQTEMKEKSGIRYNDSIISALNKSREKNIPIIAIHNHPEGLPPSIDDFNKALENNYLFGVVCGHNGQVYVYNKPKMPIELVDKVHEEIVSRCLMGVDVDRAYLETYRSLGLEYKIIRRKDDE